MKKKWLFIPAILLVFTFGTANAQQEQLQSGETREDWIRSISPVPNTEIIGKRPVIKVEFSEPYAHKTIVVLLDGTDVTQVLTRTERGFEYKPIFVLSPGGHDLLISATDQEGRQFQKSISFKTRHTGPLRRRRSTQI